MIICRGFWTTVCNPLRTVESSTPIIRNIGNPDLIDKRSRRVVPIPPGGTLSDYVPFYFTPFSIMMFNIKTGYGGIKHVPNQRNRDPRFLVASRERTRYPIRLHESARLPSRRPSTSAIWPNLTASTGRFFRAGISGTTPTIRAKGTLSGRGVDLEAHAT